MNHIKQEMEKIKIPKELHDRSKLGVMDAKAVRKQLHSATKKRTLYKRLSIAAAVCVVAFTTVTYTPVLATIQELYDKIFASEHIDDTGLKEALTQGLGQTINQTYYDETNDIHVHFDNVMTDDKETKFLLTFQSENTDLENYYFDIFEGQSKVYVVVDGQKTELHSVGWGSRYYDNKENKIAEALSFDSIKEYAGKEIGLVFENLTYYKDQETHVLETEWPLEMTLNSTAISDRETIEVNKDFAFEDQSYTVTQIEFSSTETRVVVTGTDVHRIIEDGVKYDVFSKLQHQLLNARKFEKGKGYYVDEGKSGVFLQSAGERIDPIFSKGEIPHGDDEYIMVFEPVKDRKDVVLEVAGKIKVLLTE
jgi:hypothetical protein